MESERWTVFLSHVTLQQDTGYLLGTVNTINNTLCVLSVSNISHTPNKDVNLLGTWLPFSQKQYCDTRKVSNAPFVNISTDKNGSIECSLNVNNELTKCVCVLYNPEEFKESYLFMEKVISGDTKNKVRKPSGREKSSVLEDLYQSLASVSTGEKNFITYSFMLIFKLIELLVTCCGLKFLSGIIVKLSEKICQKASLLHRALSNISILCQLYKRADFIRSFSEYHKLTPLHKLRYQNQIWSQIMDCMLGICILFLFWHFDLYNIIISVTVHWANDIAVNLTDLIYWLMGAPAGLKLNVQLTQLMGQFFLYHVYIWTGYVRLIQPVLSWITYLSVPISILGLSFQLSLLQDIISMLTLHIYCFYVYAARVYSLEVSSVAALWRLFRGKKWNILRERVDSASYDIDQLFFGTLIFTILLFLLPTILLYYSVFFCFRVIVLCFHGILSWCIGVINNIQLYTIIAWILQSKSIAGDVVFNIVPDCPHQHFLLLALQTSQLPLQTLLETTKVEKVIPSTDSSWSFIFSKVMYGHLLYPWISPANYKKKS